MRPGDAATRHRWWEDLHAIVVGAAMCALSIMFLRDAGLITGQVGGAALIASYMTPYSFGAAFIAISAPFYGFALWRIGWLFTVKSLAAVGLLTLMTRFGPEVVSVGPSDPFVAAVLAGVLAGFGLLALFRHGASLGGVGVLAVWLQDATGFKAGWTQMLVDAAVFAVAATVLSPMALLASFVGAVVLNVFIAINHRRDRYVAM